MNDVRPDWRDVKGLEHLDVVVSIDYLFYFLETKLYLIYGESDLQQLKLANDESSHLVLTCSQYK